MHWGLQALGETCTLRPGPSRPRPPRGFRTKRGWPPVGEMQGLSPRSPSLPRDPRDTPGWATPVPPHPPSSLLLFLPCVLELQKPRGICWLPRCTETNASPQVSASQSSPATCWPPVVVTLGQAMLVGPARPAFHSLCRTGNPFPEAALPAVAKAPGSQTCSCVLKLPQEAPPPRFPGPHLVATHEETCSGV